MTAHVAEPSRLWTDVDFEAEGKQVSWVHLPHSVTRSAYGTIAIPLAVIRNGEGPTILLMAGNHGDEYEGQVALCRLVRELDPADIRGRVIIMPAVNLPAAMAGARVSPIDDLNLNRCFPGNPRGRPTEQIAYFIETVLLPKANAWLDLHSGGGSLDYLPLASIHMSPDVDLNRRATAALRSFSAPFSLVWQFFPETDMATYSGQRRGIIYISSELGGMGALNPDGIRIAYEGTVRSLDHFGVLASTRFAVPPAPATRFITLRGRADYVYAPDAGLFEPLCRLGDVVKAGQPCGRVHFVDDPARPPAVVNFKNDGLLICKRHPARVLRGDCVAHLAGDFAVS